MTVNVGSYVHREVESKGLAGPITGELGVMGPTVDRRATVGAFPSGIGSREEANGCNRAGGTAVGRVSIGVMAEGVRGKGSRGRTAEIGVGITTEEEVMSKGAKAAQGIDGEWEQLDTGRIQTGNDGLTVRSSATEFLDFFLAMAGDSGIRRKCSIITRRSRERPSNGNVNGQVGRGIRGGFTKVRGGEGKAHVGGTAPGEVGGKVSGLGDHVPGRGSS